MYEELFWQSYETSELERILDSHEPRLESYRKRAEQELIKRNEQQQEITEL